MKNFLLYITKNRDFIDQNGALALFLMHYDNISKFFHEFITAQGKTVPPHRNTAPHRHFNLWQTLRRNCSVAGRADTDGEPPDAGQKPDAGSVPNAKGLPNRAQTLHPHRRSSSAAGSERGA